MLEFGFIFFIKRFPKFDELPLLERPSTLFEKVANLGNRIHFLLRYLRSPPLLIRLYKIKIGLESLSRIYLVTPLRVKNPVTHERLGLPRVLRIMNSHMDILLSRLHLRGPINRRFVNITDFTKTPSSNIGKVLLGYLNSIHEQWLTDILSCDTSIFHSSYSFLFRVIPRK